MEIDVDYVKERIANEGKYIIRPSSIQQYIACPHQWALVHLMENPQKPAAAANAGTSVHAAAELGYIDKIKTGELPPVSFLTDCAVETWQKTVEAAEEKGGLDYNKGEDYQTYEDDIVQGVETYYEQTMPHITPKAVETRYTVALDHEVMESISGTLDIDLDRGLADIKFTKRKTTASKHLLQQSTYAFLKQQNGEECNFAELHNIVRKKDVDMVGIPLKVDYARFWINHILDTTEKFLETRDPSIFRGTNPNAYYLCSPQYCGYWNKCQYVKELK